MGKTALLAVFTTGVMLTLGVVALLATASNSAPGPSLSQIDTLELTAQTRNLPDRTSENLF